MEAGSDRGSVGEVMCDLPQKICEFRSIECYLGMFKKSTTDLDDSALYKSLHFADLTNLCYKAIVSKHVMMILKGIPSDQSSLAFVSGHTASTKPDPIRTPKLNGARPG